MRDPDPQQFVGVDLVAVEDEGAVGVLDDGVSALEGGLGGQGPALDKQVSHPVGLAIDAHEQPFAGRSAQRLQLHPVRDEHRGRCGEDGAAAGGDEQPAFDVKAPGEGAPDAPVRAAFLVRDNLRQRRAIERSYVEAIRRAHTRVDIAVPYFYPGRSFRLVLRRAARRGVQVRLLLQGKIDYLSLIHI